MTQAVPSACLYRIYRDSRLDEATLENKYSENEPRHGGPAGSS